MAFRNTVLSGLLAFAGVLPATSYAVSRDNVAFSVSHSQLSVAEQPYETGASVDVYSSVNFSVTDSISLNPKLRSSYSSYGALDDNASEEILKVDASLEGCIGITPRFYIGVGGKYLLDGEEMLYKGSRGSVNKRSLGPVLTFGFESDNFDVSLSIAELFGHKKTSFDKERLMRSQHAVLSAAARSSPFDIRAELEFFHGAMADIPGGYPDLFLGLMIQLGVDVNGNLSFFPQVSYGYWFGSENCFVGEVGLGARVEW